MTEGVATMTVGVVPWRLTAAEMVILREALMTYRNREIDPEFPADAFRREAADLILAHLDEFATALLAEQTRIASKGPLSEEHRILWGHGPDWEADRLATEDDAA
jgi:hypothetical protein